MSDRVKAFLDLHARKKALETELKEVQAELDTTQAAILDDWSEQGIGSMRVNGSLVSLRRQAFATVIDGDYDRAARALKEAGLERMLRANTQTLSAWVREREEPGEPLPSFEGAIGIYERHTLSARKG